MKKWREAIYKRDDYTCQDCNNRGELQAHHIKPFAEYVHLRLDINNGQTLCIGCHGKLHGKDFSNRKKKICMECNTSIVNRGNTNLCRSCGVKKSWIEKRHVKPRSLV